MKLRDWLELNKLSTYQFAEAIDFTQAAVSKWCNGTIPRVKPMQAIEKATKGAVTAADFYRG